MQSGHIRQSERGASQGNKDWPVKWAGVNNHGKPRLVRFYQRFVSAQLRHVLSGRLRPLPFFGAVRRSRAAAADLGVQQHE